MTPVVLLAATAAFSTSTAWSRWYTGSEGARASRYVYLLAALTLPALAVAAQALVSRWRVLVVPLCALFLVAVPHNVAAFEPNVFGENYMRERQRIATTAVRMPFAADVPSDVRPESDPYDGDLTIGFLLDAASEGRLEPSTFPITERVENEFRIRLGVAQRPIADPPTGLATAMEGCETRAEPIVLTPPVGERIRITSTVTLVTVDERGEVTSSPVQRAPEAGAELSFELPDLRVRITPGARSATFTVCTP